MRTGFRGINSSLEGAKLLPRSLLLWVVSVAHTLCSTEIGIAFKFQILSNSLQRIGMDLKIECQ